MKSALIVGALVLAFVFYIAAKGELASYLAVFIGPVTAGPPVGASAAAVGSLASNLAIPSLSGGFSDPGSGTVGSGVANSDITDTSFGGIPDGGDVAGEIAGDM